MKIDKILAESASAKVSKILAGPDYPKMLREAATPDYTRIDKILAESVSEKVSKILAGPDYTKTFREAAKITAGPDYPKIVRRAAGLPDFEKLLKTGTPPRVTATVLSGLRDRHGVSVAGYGSAVAALLRSIEFEDDWEHPAFTPRPTSDDTAYKTIAFASPEMAEEIDLAAQKAKNPLLPADVIRNMLAWLVVALIVTAYIGGGTLFFPPWGALVLSVLGAGGVNAPAAYRKIVGPSEDHTS